MTYWRSKRKKAGHFCPAVAIECFARSVISDRNIAVQAEIYGPHGIVLTSQHVPRAIRRPEDGQIRRLVQIERPGHGNIVGRSEMNASISCTAAVDVPVTIRRTEHGDIRLTIAVKISGDRNITWQTPLEDRDSIRRPVNVPGARRGPEDRLIAPSVAVKVTRDWYVTFLSPMDRGERAVRAPSNVPIPI